MCLIEPDVEVELREEEFEEGAKEEPEEIFQQIKEEEKEQKEKVLQTEETKEIKITLKEFMLEQGFYDNQLIRAVDLLKGIKLYKKQLEM